MKTLVFHTIRDSSELEECTSFGSRGVYAIHENLAMTMKSPILVDFLFIYFFFLLSLFLKSIIGIFFLLLFYNLFFYKELNG